MSIKSVRAIAYRIMEKFRDKDKDSPIPAWADQFDNVWIIHITNVGHQKLFKATDEKVLVLEFEDIDPEMFSTGYFGSSDIEDQSVLIVNCKTAVLFTEEQAKMVLAFLKKANTDPNANDALLVNCMAGISRSGAVVDFARVMFGIDYEQFARLNPGIIPNSFVKRRLFASWRADETFEDE